MSDYDWELNAVITAN